MAATAKIGRNRKRESYFLAVHTTVERSVITWPHRSPFSLAIYFDFKLGQSRSTIVLQRMISLEQVLQVIVEEVFEIFVPVKQRNFRLESVVSKERVVHSVEKIECNAASHSLLEMRILSISNSSQIECSNADVVHGHDSTTIFSREEFGPVLL